MRRSLRALAEGQPEFGNNDDGTTDTPSMVRTARRAPTHARVRSQLSCTTRKHRMIGGGATATTGDGHFDGTIFAVMRNFMIQGGGFTKDMSQKSTRAPIENDAGATVQKRARSTLAMCRSPRENQ